MAKSLQYNIEMWSPIHSLGMFNEPKEPVVLIYLCIVSIIYDFQINNNEQSEFIISRIPRNLLSCSAKSDSRVSSADFFDTEWSMHMCTQPVIEGTIVESLIWIHNRILLPGMYVESSITMPVRSETDLFFTKSE